MNYTREETAMLGLEIVAYAGDARSKLLLALQAARNNDRQKSQQLIAEAETFLVTAHKIQTKMIQEEAQGANHDFGFIFIHGQDHLMNTLLLRDLVQHILYLYEIKL